MLRKMILLILAVFLINTNLVHAESCNITVSPSQSIQQAINQASAGQTVCVKTGNYKEEINVNKPITLQNLPNENPVIEGDYQLPTGTDKTNGNLTATYKGLVRITADNVTFKGFKVQKSRGQGIIVEGVNNVTVQDNFVLGSRMQGITAMGDSSTNLSKNISFINNISEANSEINKPNWTGGGSGLRFGKVEQGLMQGNISRYNYGEGIIIDANDGRSKNNKVVGNTIHDNMATQFYAHATSELDYIGNLVFVSNANPYANFGGGRGCIIIKAQEVQSYQRAGNKGHNTENINIYNNLNYNCGGGVRIATNAPESNVRNIKIYNNTFVNSDNSTDIYTNEKSGGGQMSGIDIQNNIFYWEGNGNGYRADNGDVGISFSNNLWSTNNPSGISGNNILDQNPQLKGKSGSGDFPVLTSSQRPGENISYAQIKSWFELKRESYAIGKSNSVTPNLDFYGCTRDGNKDLGAIEFSAADCSQTNPTPTTEPTPTADPTPTYNPKYDLDGNGKVGVLDLVELVKYIFR